MSNAGRARYNPDYKRREREKRRANGEVSLSAMVSAEAKAFVDKYQQSRGFRSKDEALNDLLLSMATKGR